MTTTAAQSADAVVVGAGHNGLVAANLLADAGWDVVVLEATAVPGGAVRSAEVTAPGYLSDLYSSFYPLGYASPVLARPGPGSARAVLAARAGRAGAPAAGRPGRGDQPGPGRHGGLAGAVRPRRRRALAATRTPTGVDVAEPMLEAITTPFPPVRGGLGLLRRLRVAGALRLARRLVAAGPQARRRAVRRRGRAGAAGRLRPAHRPVPGGGRLRGVRLAAGHARPAGRLAGARRRRAADHRRAGGPAAGARRPDRLRRPGRPGARPPGAGRWGSAPSAARCGGPGGPCSPTCPRRRSTSTWSARRRCRPGWWRTWRTSGGTARRSRSTGRSSAPVPWTNPAVAGAGTVHLGADLDGLTHYAGRAGPGELPRDPFLLVGQMSHGRPEPLAAGHRVALGVHPPAVPAELAGRGDRRARASGWRTCWRRRAPGFRQPDRRPARGRAGRPGAGQPEPGRRRARRRHRRRVPAAVPAPDPRPGPGGHPGGPALPGQRVGAPRRRGARRARARTRPAPRWPATGPLTGRAYAAAIATAHRADLPRLTAAPAHRPPTLTPARSR